MFSHVSSGSYKVIYKIIFVKKVFRVKTVQI